jgi:hypothetical protein
VEVNFLYYLEQHPDGQERTWTWVVVEFPKENGR